MTELLSLSRIGHPDEIEMLLEVDVDAKTFQEMEPDEDTGTMVGQDATLIRLAMENAKQEGYILGAPYPTAYLYTGDFKTDLARILVAEDYVLPDDWMAAAQLNEAEPEEEGVVN